MTDRELLELAAKAAGLKISARHQAERDVLIDPATAALWLTSGHTGWNPLTNDGDALRLLNKLWLQLRHVHGSAHAGEPGRFWCSECWFPDGDQDAATRRAIVRAAAHVAQAARIPSTSQERP